MGITRRFKPKYESKNHEIVAGLRDAAGAVAPLDPYKVVKRKAAEVSTAMALIHGGDWRVVVNHETGYVLVAPRLPDA